MGLERKNAIDDACLFVGIVFGSSFFHTLVYFYSSSCLVTLPHMAILSENLTVEGFEPITSPKRI